MSRSLVTLVAVAALAIGARGVEAAEVVTFHSQAQDGATLSGRLLRPVSAVRAPAIVALHGCTGLLNKQGRMLRRDLDWGQRLAAAGYVVLFPDSFGPRGIERVCETRQRRVFPRHRAGDAAGAADWLAAQPFVDPDRIAIIGWSHGGSSTLWAVSGAFKPKAGEWRAAIAFYPGCRVPSESADWQPRLKPHVLMGSADDWTPPEPCRRLAERGAVRLVEYPGAVHGFDAPDTPRRTRTGVAFSARGDGKVEIGTDPEARAAAIDEVMSILKAAFR